MDFEKPSRGPDRTAIVALTGQGAELALRLGERLPSSGCFLPRRHAVRGAVAFDRVSEVLPRLWGRYDHLVCIMAAGIVVRLIAPLLSHKSTDPAVVVLDEKGRFAVSLVSGHLGGANRLARRIGELIGAQPVITTASDVQGKPALDLIAVDAGLEIENIVFLSRVSRAVIEEEPLWIFDPDRRIGSRFEEQPEVVLLPKESSEECEPAVEESEEAFRTKGTGLGAETLPEANPAARRGRLAGKPDWPGQTEDEHSRVRARIGVWVSEVMPPPKVRCLKLRPRNLVVGLGCNRGTPAGEIIELVKQAFRRAKLSPLSIRNFASIDLKADEPGVLDTAKSFNRPVSFFPGSALGEVRVPSPSAIVAKHIGVESVCEATALLSAQSGTLVLTKRKSANATLAVARVGFP